MTRRLTDRRALVTGAASGLGRAIAEAYSDEGASVALVDVDADRLERADAEIGAETVAIECDVRDPDAVESAVGRAVEAWGGLDAVVNNAGVITREALARTSEEELDRMVDVNLKGALRTARAAVPALSDGGGSLINMSSIAGAIGLPDRSVYSATKSGLAGLTRQLAVELAPEVRVNAIAPGTIETPISEDVRRDPGYVDRRQESIPLDRFGDPEEVAGPAVFLASEEASYVTGHVLFVDGGRSIA